MPIIASAGRSRATSLALTWLNESPESAHVLATARQLMAIENHLKRQLPAAFARNCRAARLENDSLTIAVPSAGFAAKLRQMAPRLLSELNASGWHLNELNVKVQASLAQYAAKKPPREVQPLAPESLKAFRALLEATPAGPLADAIQRLLAHHGG